MSERYPQLIVLASLFPSPKQPMSGLFIRERMFRVGQQCPIKVVSPQPWFPFQSLIRLLKPQYRPVRPAYEVQQGVEVYSPRFFAIPGILRRWDGFFMALASYRLIKKLERSDLATIIDSHFAYPEGYSACYLSRWLGLPYSITLRGTEIPHSRIPSLSKRLVSAIKGSAKTFSVSEDLRQHAIALGVSEDKVKVVGNGVDAQKFSPVDKQFARRQLNLPEDATVMISVGGLVERKGFHRVIEAMPGILEKYPKLIYLVVGGASAEGDWSNHLKTMVKDLKLEANVRFTGPIPPEELRIPLSASDVSILASSNEGWANVILEAMACGLPVIATDVGGNSEVVSSDELGAIVPFGDQPALEKGIKQALDKDWDDSKIIRYAKENSWDKRVSLLLSEFTKIAANSNA